MRIIIIGLLLLLLIACGPRLRMKAWGEVERSKAAYKECLSRCYDDPDKCAAYRKAYEADIRAFRAIMGRDLGADIEYEKKK